MVSIEFLITALVVVLVPGTGVVYTIAVGLGRGRLASVAASLGCTGATILHLMAALMGLAAVLHASALLFQVIKWAGALYLIYLAWQTLRDRGPVRFEAESASQSLGKTAWTGFVINILNPKISIFFLAFLPQFISPATQNAVGDIFVLGSVFVLMTLVVFIAYGQLAGFMRDRVLSNARAMAWMRRVSAGAFAAMGLRLAFDRS